MELAFYDCDVRKRAKLSTVMKFIADSAGKDYAARGFSHQNLLESNQVFLLSRISMHFHRMPLHGENGHRKDMGARHKRAFFTATTKSGTKRASCGIVYSAWVLVEPHEEIIRPSAFSLHKVPETESIKDCRTAKGSKSPKPSRISEAENPVQDIDGNGHLYNAFTAASPRIFFLMKCRFLTLGPSDQFQQGSKTGRTLDIYSSDEEDERRRSSWEKRKISCFECELYYV
jgi:hypothetical protein